VHFPRVIERSRKKKATKKKRGGGGEGRACSPCPSINQLLSLSPRLWEKKGEEGRTRKGRKGKGGGTGGG